MYINFNYLNKIGLSVTDLAALQALHQNRVEDLNAYINSNFDLNSISEYTSTLKNGDYRLNKKGKELLDRIQIANYHENDEKLADFLLDKYKEEKLVICPKNKLLKLIAWFRAETSFTHKEIYSLIVNYFESEESIYNKRLDFLFWKPTTAYSVQKLSESRLYNWYESNNDKFDF
jgi:hypothetical protein